MESILFSMNPISEFLNSIYLYLTNSPIVNKKNIIKVHLNNCSKLSHIGDISFPIDLNIWRKLLMNTDGYSHDKITFNECKTILDYIDIDYNEETSKKLDERINRFIESSLDWIFKIDKITINQSKCVIYLDRQTTYLKMLNTVLERQQMYGQLEKNDCIVKVTPGHEKLPNSLEIVEDSTTITEYRICLIYNALINLIRFSKYNLCNEVGGVDYDFSVFITYKSNVNTENLKKCNKIICGVVNNSKIDDKLQFSANEYISKRCTDIQLIAEHRYGVRKSYNQQFYESIRKIGIAAVTIDLLEVKHSSPVSLSALIMSQHGTSKGAAFILYNSARLETLIRKYEQKVQDKIYPELPELSKIDISLLKEEEEWQLMFIYVIGFPNLIERTVGDLDKGFLSLHLICSFLHGLVSLFSVYYRRVRILTEMRPNLLNVLQARIYLLYCIRIVLNNCMSLLSIDPITYM